MDPKGTHYIDGRWKPGNGQPFISVNPGSGEQLWKGCSAGPKDVDAAVNSARAAAPAWSALHIDRRIAFLKAFSAKLTEHRSDLAKIIGMETGKVLWEAESEVGAMINKADISIDAYKVRCPELRDPQAATLTITRYKPHGVLAVFGPYNFPGHLPNGHIIPALLAGNTVVFKPSELTPLVAQRTIEIWLEAGLPTGVLQLVQGGRDTGQSLAQHPQIDGLLFTGSAKTGQSLSKQFGAQPEKILALEMGGNNPLIVTSVSNLKAAAYMTILSAYLSSGQRCTCARRLIVPHGEQGNAFIASLRAMIPLIQVGKYDDTPPPFMGPVVSTATAKQLLTAQDQLLQAGAEPLIPMTSMQLGDAFLKPGLIDVTQVGERSDDEIFGPLLQVIRVADIKAAIEEANRSQYGLSAGIFTDSRKEFDTFYHAIRAGVVNWNQPLTGASSRMPFGGIGMSGNHRPSAFYAADYCAYPVASMEADDMKMPSKIAPGIDL